MGQAMITERVKLLNELRTRRELAVSPTNITCKDGDFGYLALQIPMADYNVLMKHNPELANKDTSVSIHAWNKFIQSPASDIYKVDKGIGRKKTASGIIIK